MSNFTRFQDEFIKQMQTEWISNVEKLTQELVQKKNNLIGTVERIQELATIPGSLQMASEKDMDSINCGKLLEKIWFGNRALLYLRHKREEMHLRLHDKDPEKMAVVFQKMDQTRLELFGCNANQAEMLLTKIRSASEAFNQVNLNYDVHKFTDNLKLGSRFGKWRRNGKVFQAAKRSRGS